MHFLTCLGCSWLWTFPSAPHPSIILWMWKFKEISLRYFSEHCQNGFFLAFHNARVIFQNLPKICMRNLLSVQYMHGLMDVYFLFCCGPVLPPLCCCWNCPSLRAFQFSHIYLLQMWINLCNLGFCLVLLCLAFKILFIYF